MFEIDFKLIISSLVTILMMFSTYFTVQIYILRQKYQHIPGPPSNGILGFYLGNLIELMIDTRYKKRIMNETFLRWYFKKKILKK